VNSLIKVWQTDRCEQVSYGKQTNDNVLSQHRLKFSTATRWTSWHARCKLIRCTTDAHYWRHDTQNVVRHVNTVVVIIMSVGIIDAGVIRFKTHATKWLKTWWGHHTLQHHTHNFAQQCTVKQFIINHLTTRTLAKFCLYCLSPYKF